MFGRRRRRQEAELRALRAKLAEIDAAAVARSEQTVSTLMEQMQSAQAGRDSVVEHLWCKVIEQDQGLAGAVEHVAGLCAVIAETLDAQRLEQRQVGELLSAVARELTTKTSLPAAPRAIDSSFFSTEPPPDGDAVIEIDETRNGALIAASDGDTAGSGNRSRQGWRGTP